MRVAVQFIVLAMVAQAVMAEDVLLPSCTNADGSKSVLYDVQDARFVSGLNSVDGAPTTTRFLDCGSQAGYEIMSDGSMPDVVDGSGNDVNPPSALGIISMAMGADLSLTMTDIMRNVEGGGFQTRPFNPASDCMCTEEMRHEFD